MILLFYYKIKPLPVHTPIRQITLKELEEWKKAGKDFQLIDVRELEEHEAFNIGGTLIPLGEILRKVDQLDTSRPIIFYCKRGIRSQIAIQRLQPLLNYSELYNLFGGILPLLKSTL